MRLQRTKSKYYYLPWHYEVRRPEEAHKLGIIETNAQEKNTRFIAEPKI